MKCKNDNSEMIKGYLCAHGQKWVEGTLGKFYKIMVGQPLVGNWVNLVAWRCPKCGEIKLYSSD